MLVSNNKKVLIKILLIFIILLNILKIHSLAVVSPTSDFYVNDYASLLNSDTKNYIISANKSLYSQTGSQIVVVTIPSLGGNSLEDYATQLFRNFGIGSKNKNNGVLLLLALEERQFRVEVGYGLEGILPDAKTGRIQDEYIIPYLKQNNWNDGIKNGFSAILNIVANEYNVEVGAETAVATEYVDTSKDDSNMIVFCFMGIPIISLIFGIISGILDKKKTIKKKNLIKILAVYMVIIAISYHFIVKDTPLEGVESFVLKQLALVGFFTIFNLIWLVSGMSWFSGGKGYRGGGFYGGGSSGGFSSGGGSFGKIIFKQNSNIFKGLAYNIKVFKIFQINFLLNS